MNLHEHKQEMFLKEEEDQSLAVILSIICMVVTIIAVFTFGVCQQMNLCLCFLSSAYKSFTYTENCVNVKL